MKKIAYIFAIGATMLAASSCKQNTEPKFERTPTLELNTPPMADQYFELTPEGTLDLTWSQPDWGFAAAASYQVEVSFQEDFHYYENNTPAYYFTCPTVYHKCNAQVSMEDIAIAMCTLRGITEEEQYTDEPAREIYVRVHGFIPGILESSVRSNAIKLEQVKGYCAIQSPGKFYFVGQPEGWMGPEESNKAHYADWALIETEIGNGIYKGSFDILGGQAMFRFYSALTGWDADSYGSQTDDNPLDFEFTDNQFSYILIGPGGKGAFNFPSWEGGSMDITIDMANQGLTIVAHPN